METKTLRELLALGLALPTAERVRLAHELLRSVADPRTHPPGGEVAEEQHLALFDVDSIFEAVRDKTPGREVEL